jgi:pilus assembly protein CpaE
MTQSTDDKIGVLIVDDIPETRENLRKLLYFEPDIEIVGMASNGTEAIEQAKASKPDVLLMDINMPDMDGISASQEIARVAPACQVIMMSVQSEADYLRRSMLAGAMDFLTKPFSGEELAGSIRRVYEMGASRRASAPAAPVEIDGMPPAPGTAGREPRPGGKVLLIYSPKGGTGCSTVAANLAIALKTVTSKKVALMDGSLQFGDAGVLFNLQGNRTIADLTARMDSLDPELLSTVMAPHPSDVRILAAPASPEAAEIISAEDIKTLLTLLRKNFDYVVVDSWTHLDDIVLAAMDVADRVVLVMTPEIPSIKSTKQFFEVAEALKYPISQVDLVLNKVLPRDGIRRDQLERSMNHTIVAEMLFDPKSFREATNQGLPMVMKEPANPLSEGFLEMARLIFAALEPQPVEESEEDETEPPTTERRKPGGLFGRLRR